MRYLITNGTSILRSGYTATGVTQANLGENEYFVQGADGAQILDTDLEVVDGVLVAKPGYMGDVPDVTLTEEPE